MNSSGTFYLPAASSTMAPEVDALLQFIVVTSSILFAIVVFGSFYFAVRYRRRNRSEFTDGKDHNVRLEIVWTVIPSILAFIVFFWGFNSYLKMNIAPAHAIEVKTTAQKWFWQFTYANGAGSTNELVVPVGVPVKLLMSSKDVIHSFYVPNFRMKMDVLPNRYSITWFEATQTGEYDLFCTEFCGTGHSSMLGKVKVVSDTEFQDFLKAGDAAGAGLAPEIFGSDLFKSKACFTCHTTDGAPGTGPTFKGIFSRTEVLADGSRQVVDENYIRESILNPQAKIVSGFQPVMPTYQGILKDAEVDALVAYLKSLNTGQ